MSYLKSGIEKPSPLKRAMFALEKLQLKFDAVEFARTEPIAIIGMGCRFPGANNPDAYWQLLHGGVDAITEVPRERWDNDALFDTDPNALGKLYTRHGGFLSGIDRFDPMFFGISPREAVDLDPQQRLLLEVTWEALENAGQVPGGLIGQPVGVFVGSTQMDYGSLQYSSPPENITAYSLTGGGLSFIAGRLSYVLGLRGPALALDTACSSSLVALHLACQSLRNAECELALAGGVNLILFPEITISLSRTQSLSPDGRCKTFDAAGDGFARGEGCGIVVLKRLSDAIADKDNILALIRGSAVNHDGVSGGFTVPNEQAQEKLIRRALENAGLTPAQIDYVEAHGTGTSLGDPIEVGALGTVFGEEHSSDSPLTIGSVKSNFGHLEAAASIAGLIKIVLSLQHEEIPAHLHFKEPNPHIDWENLPIRVPVKRQSWLRGEKSRFAGVSSFGMSGTNAHVVLEEAPPVNEPPVIEAERPFHLLTLSAKSNEALRELAENYAAWLEAHPETTLADACFTASTGRSHFEHRLALVAGSREEAQKQLRAANYTVGIAHRKRPKIAFLFTGQGSEYVDMGRQLYETQALFRETLDRCDAILRPLNVPLLDLLYPQSRNSDIELSTDMTYLQPVLFALEYALAELWQSWGVTPDVVMGHSVGEYVAACVAGIFSLEDGLKFVAARGRLMQTCDEGKMLAVSVSETRAMEIIAPYGQDVSVATINSPESVVISGRPEAVEAILASLIDEEGIETKLLPIPRASHSAMMEPALPELEKVAESITYARPRVPLCSNVTGKIATNEITTPGYWVRHLRQPVRFAESVKTLYGQGFESFLEIGPKPALLGMARQCLPDGATKTWLPSLREGQEDWRQMLDSLGQWYVRGGAVDWVAFDREYPRHKVSLPTYPFQRQRYWVDRARLARRTAQDLSDHPLLGRRLRLSRSEDIYFESKIDLSSITWFTDHRVFDVAVFPATGYLAMVLAAATDILSPSRQGLPGSSARDDNKQQELPVSIRDIAIEQALILPEEETTTVQLVLSPIDSGYRFEIFSLRTESGWRPHATGQLVSDGIEEESDAVDITRLQTQYPTEISVADHYRTCYEHGLNYGPGFQAIKRLFRGEGVALGEIELPESLAREIDNYRLHPALFDAALQVILSATSNASNETYLPIAVKELRVYRHAGIRLWSFARVIDSDEKGFTADVSLFDEQGINIAEIGGFTAGRVSHEVLQRHFRKQSNDLYEIAWQARPLEVEKPITDENPGSWLIFADRGGMGQELTEHLEASGNTCILVHAENTSSRQGLPRPSARDGKNNNNEWYLDPADPADFQRLFTDALRKETPPLRGIVHLWSLDTPDTPELTTEKLTEVQTLTCGSVLHLLQAQTKQKQSAGVWPRLWLITRNAVNVGEPQDSLAVAQAPLWGLGKVIALEHPELRCTRVDLDPSIDKHAEKETNAEILFGEIRLGGEEDPKEDQIAFRDGDRYVARLVPHGQEGARGRLEVPHGKPYQLQIPRRGTLDDLELALVTRRPPETGEVEIRVRASGLNFRDVLNALDLYPGDPGPLGGECAGEIVAVGEGVEDFRIGDPVIAMAPGSFSQYVTVNAALVTLKPEALGFEEAATIPVVFLTAWYALHHLANLSAGDRVLIHAASGGVGQAAIQLAQLAGAEIFATASLPKWKFLESLGVKHIMNSRTLDFVEEIRGITEGQGVDIVLNSLTSEGFIEKSLSVLKDGGRFLEISKVGVWQPEQVTEFNPELSYFLIDLAQMCQEQPVSIQAMLRELIPLFEAGHLKPLPCRVFPIPDTISAFRYMQQARHIGKIVLTPPADTTDADASTLIRSDATYLITGGLGALGLEVACWMVKQGARHLVLTGRRGPSDEARRVIEQLEETGARILVVNADVSDGAQVIHLFEKMEAEMPPLKGIIHAAGILDDGVLLQQKLARFERVLAPKVTGSWILHTLTLDRPLDFFVCFSSIASLLGSSGQGNYAAANAFMDTLVHHRRAMGLPGLSINWGVWGKIGLAANLDSRDRDRLAAMGMDSIEPERGISILGQLMGQSEAIQVGVFPVNWPRFLQQFPVAPAFLSELYRSPPTQSSTSANFIESLKKISDEKQRGYLSTHIQSEINKVLGFDPSRPMDSRKKFSALGMDSLMVVEFTNRLQTSLECSLPSALLFQYSTLDELVDHITNEILALESPWHKHDATGKTEEKPINVPEKHLASSIRSGEKSYPQLHNQQECYLWHEQIENKTCLNLYTVSRLRSPVDVSAMGKASQMLLDRHDSLRMIYARHGSDFVQEVQSDQTVDFESLDMRARSPDDIAKVISVLIREPFDPETGPMLRARLFSREEDDHVFLMIVHHIAVDGISLDILHSELWSLYRTCHAGIEPDLPPVTKSFTDYVRWQTARQGSSEGEQLWQYWKEQLGEELPRLDFPTDYLRPMINRHYGAADCPISLDAKLIRQLRELARSRDVTPNVLFVSAFQTLLYRCTGRRDFSTGMHIANRTRPEFSRTVGYLADMAPIRARISPGMTFGELLRQTHRAVTGAIAHQGHTAGLLAKRLQPERHPSYSYIEAWFTMLPLSLFENYGSFLDTDVQVERGGLCIERFNCGESGLPLLLGSWYDLELSLLEGSDTITGSLGYNTDLFEKTTIKRLVTQFQSLLEAIVIDPEQTI